MMLAEGTTWGHVPSAGAIGRESPATAILALHMDAKRVRKGKHAHGGGYEHREWVGRGICKKVSQSGQGVCWELQRLLAPRAALEKLWEISTS